MTRPGGRHQRIVRSIGSRVGDPFDDARIEPFDAIPLDVASFWA
jgi:hypothetical protein